MSCLVLSCLVLSGLVSSCLVFVAERENLHIAVQRKSGSGLSDHLAGLCESLSKRPESTIVYVPTKKCEKNKINKNDSGCVWGGGARVVEGVRGER